MLLSTKLAKVTPEGVNFEDGTSVACRTVVWTAGVQANALASRYRGTRAEEAPSP